MCIGLQSRTAIEEQEAARSDLPIPDQALLHLQHPDHPAERPRLELVYDLSGETATCEIRF